MDDCKGETDEGDSIIMNPSKRLKECLVGAAGDLAVADLSEKQPGHPRFFVGSDPDPQDYVDAIYSILDGICLIHGLTRRTSEKANT